MITEELLNNLILAIKENKDYYISDNGLTIESKSTDNSFSLLISYDRSNDIEELAKFQEYLDLMDDELFVDICEDLGEEGISKIQEYLESEELDKVQLGILIFKDMTSRFVKSKIELLQRYV